MVFFAFKEGIQKNINEEVQLNTDIDYIYD